MQEHEHGSDRESVRGMRGWECQRTPVAGKETRALQEKMLPVGEEPGIAGPKPAKQRLQDATDQRIGDCYRRDQEQDAGNSLPLRRPYVQGCQYETRDQPVGPVGDDRKDDIESRVGNIPIQKEEQESVEGNEQVDHSLEPPSPAPSENLVATVLDKSRGHRTDLELGLHLHWKATVIISEPDVKEIALLHTPALAHGPGLDTDALEFTCRNSYSVAFHNLAEDQVVLPMHEAVHGEGVTRRKIECTKIVEKREPIVNEWSGIHYQLPGRGVIHNLSLLVVIYRPTVLPLSTLKEMLLHKMRIEALDIDGGPDIVPSFQESIGDVDGGALPLQDNEPTPSVLCGLNQSEPHEDDAPPNIVYELLTVFEGPLVQSVRYQAPIVAKAMSNTYGITETIRVDDGGDLYQNPVPS